MRYFFDVSEEEDQLIDRYGSEYDSIEAARKDAIDIAKQVMLEAAISRPVLKVSVTLRSLELRQLYVVSLTVTEHRTDI